jgi:hypothetical protein
VDRRARHLEAAGGAPCYDHYMPDSSQALRPNSGGSGRSFLGVRHMQPREDGVRLVDDSGEEVGVVRYGEQVYINGRVMSFTAPKAS